MIGTTVRGTKAVLAAALALSLALGAAGCASSKASGPDDAAKPAEAPVAAFPVTITDDASRTVTIEARPERVVSLAPANTEIVAALGGLDRLVGVTTYCDYPPAVKDLPKVGDFATPNVEAIIAADADVVFATGGVQADVIGQLEQAGATVVVIDPQRLDTLYDSIVDVGAVLGNSAEAEALVAGMKEDLAEIEEAVGTEQPATAFLEIAQNPLFTAGPGTLLDDLVTAAGGRNVVKGSGYVGYSVEQLLADDPSVYLATKGSMSNPAELEKRAGYGKLGAVKAGRVAVLDDNLVSRPGPRIVEGVRLIAEALHPEALR